MLRAALLTLSCLLLPASTQPEGIFPERSPRAKVSQVIGMTEVALDYGRPRVNSRPIWGDLVPFGKLWRAGANLATTIKFAGPVTIYGNKVPAGTYSLQMIPDKDQWTILLDRRNTMWGAGEEIRPQDIVLRIYRKPRFINQHTEWLTYEITPTSPASAYVTLRWERLEIEFLVEVDVDAYVAPRIKRLLANGNGQGWEPFAEAALYLWEQGKDLDNALELANRSIKLQENPRNLYIKAQILRDKGDPGQAWAIMTKADKLAQSTKAPAKWAYPIQEALTRWRQPSQIQPGKARGSRG